MTREFQRNFQVLDGFRLVKCDCTCGTPCPYGQIGTSDCCWNLKKIEQEWPIPSGDETRR